MEVIVLSWNKQIEIPRGNPEKLTLRNFDFLLDHFMKKCCSLFCSECQFCAVTQCYACISQTSGGGVFTFFTIGRLGIKFPS